MKPVEHKSRQNHGRNPTVREGAKDLTEGRVQRDPTVREGAKGPDRKGGCKGT